MSLESKIIGLERKVQLSQSEAVLEKQKNAGLLQQIRDLTEERREGVEQRKQREQLQLSLKQVEFQTQMGAAELSNAKLQLEVDFLKKSIKQQEKELEVNRVQSKEYLKSCNSLFKQNTTVAASREKFHLR